MKLSDDSSIPENALSSCSASTVHIQPHVKPHPLWHHKTLRLWMVLMLCGAVTVENLMRNSFGIAVVCMINATWSDNWCAHDLRLHNDTMARRFEKIADNLLVLNLSTLTEGENGIFDDAVQVCSINAVDDMDYEGELEWNPSQEAQMFSMIFWATLVTGLPGGYLADRYGPKFLLLISMTLHILGTVLFPLAALNAPYIVTIGLRFIFGLGLGLVSACVNAFVANWFAPSERTTAVAIWTTGNQLGTLLAFPLGTIFCPLKHILLGWPLIFYLCSAVGIVWMVFFAFVATNTPSKNRFISQEEADYLRVELADTKFESKRLATSNVPWKSIALSGAVWAMMAMNFSATMLQLTLASYLPTYFKSALKLDLKTNGVLSSLPFLTQWIVKMIVSVAVDRLKKKTNINHTTLAKIANTIGCIGSSVSLVLASLVDCTQRELAITAMCCCFAFLSAFVPSFLTSMVTIAPAYTGVLTSVLRVSSAAGGVLGPVLIAEIVREGTQNEWRVVFAIMALSLLASGVIYMIWGSVEVQPWALPKSKSMSTIDSEVHMKSSAVSAPQFTIRPIKM